ncbi:hypothetical protein XA68_11143 [Ophiocordyceps unilateralis]|uniref:Uncharacterized protein n=1 Tax=Ophiocordyceps unilateralis TaxID=268505 RepID=A0A2A9P284_OPHUN|nr:hypothetical protein XA68_11143 [Ophiocordyceps unilateralis]
MANNRAKPTQGAGKAPKATPKTLGGAAPLTSARESPVPVPTPARFQTPRVETPVPLPASGAVSGPRGSFQNLAISNEVDMTDVEAEAQIAGEMTTKPPTAATGSPLTKRMLAKLQLKEKKRAQKADQAAGLPPSKDCPHCPGKRHWKFECPVAKEIEKAKRTAKNAKRKAGREAAAAAQGAKRTKSGSQAAGGPAKDAASLASMPTSARSAPSLRSD